MIIPKICNFTTINQQTKGLRVPAKTPHSPYTFAIVAHLSEKPKTLNKGKNLAYIGITVNLIIAGIIIISMFGKFSDLIDIISDWPLSLGIGITALYISGNYIGKKMEYLINHKNWNSILIGIIGLLSILLIGIFFGSTVGFLQEGIENIGQENGLKNALIDYYIKPLFWVILFGIIPTILVGGIMGWNLKTKA